MTCPTCWLNKVSCGGQWGGRGNRKWIAVFLTRDAQTVVTDPPSTLPNPSQTIRYRVPLLLLRRRLPCLVYIRRHPLIRSAADLMTLQTNYSACATGIFGRDKMAVFFCSGTPMSIVTVSKLKDGIIQRREEDFDHAMTTQCYHSSRKDVLTPACMSRGSGGLARQSSPPLLLRRLASDLGTALMVEPSGVPLFPQVIAFADLLCVCAQTVDVSATSYLLEWAVPSELSCRGGGFRAGMISWENFVFERGGGIFPREITSKRGC